MVMENPLINLTEIMYTLPPKIIEQIRAGMVILKTLGIVFIIYVIYILFKIIIDFRRGRLLKTINKKLETIEEKLDTLLKERKKKERKRTNFS